MTKPVRPGSKGKAPLPPGVAPEIGRSNDADDEKTIDTGRRASLAGKGDAERSARHSATEPAPAPFAMIDELVDISVGGTTSPPEALPEVRVTLWGKSHAGLVRE